MPAILQKNQWPAKNVCVKPGRTSLIGLSRAVLIAHFEKRELGVFELLSRRLQQLINVGQLPKRIQVRFSCPACNFCVYGLNELMAQELKVHIEVGQVFPMERFQPGRPF